MLFESNTDQHPTRAAQLDPGSIMPCMIGFVSLAGVVVNDSILLVMFVKHHASEGMDAASQAVRDRFRAIFLTSATTVAGMTPLLFETSMQA